MSLSPSLVSFVSLVDIDIWNSRACLCVSTLRFSAGLIATLSDSSSPVSLTRIRRPPLGRWSSCHSEEEVKRSGAISLQQFVSRSGHSKLPSTRISVATRFLVRPRKLNCVCLIHFLKLLLYRKLAGFTFQVGRDTLEYSIWFT